jgi:hypothetical protein
MTALQDGTVAVLLKNPIPNRCTRPAIRAPTKGHTA